MRRPYGLTVTKGPSQWQGSRPHVLARCPKEAARAFSVQVGLPIGSLLDVEGRWPGRTFRYRVFWNGRVHPVGRRGGRG